LLSLYSQVLTERRRWAPARPARGTLAGPGEWLVDRAPANEMPPSHW